ncbi:efflux RND transporter periplasmic adaptor subunit [Thalassomonas sp. M1454]|uniref:efflux RND transporter periplasmic adaptor subunit n=1 Tax=Thalassomonas sp. M1454 TaxID=2594477 RepID=UPI00117C5C90|nr:efflux RND transporter periplasmic adaptor subunit [Thalassomonas sp. M1454]TRX54062.1 efflux RND transporter periplasmic adaptor subunit [Thalassomonas sp. M1454]
MSAVKSKLKLILIPIIIILVGILVLAFMGKLAKPPEKKQQISLAPLVNVFPIKHETVAFSIKSQGSVVPRTETSLITEVSGMITYVSKNFRVGGYFKKGDVLLEIDPITYEVDVLQAQSRLGAAQAVLVEEKARADQAEDEWLLSGMTVEEAPILALRLPQLQKAEADVLAAQADLKQAEIKLERTKIIAPYDALVKEKQVDIGQYVTSGIMLAKTFAIDYAEVRLPVKQQDIAFINLPKVNQDIQQSIPVTITAKKGEKVQSWNSFISRFEGEINQQSRVHYLIAKIDDPYNLTELYEHEEELRIGTFVNAEIQGMQSESVIVLPREVVRGPNSIHMVDKQNKLHIVDIDIIRSEKKYVYIADNINTEMRVVSTKIAKPVEGMAVRIFGEWVPPELPEESDVAGEQ